MAPRIVQFLNCLECAPPETDLKMEIVVAAVRDSLSSPIRYPITITAAKPATVLKNV